QVLRTDVARPGGTGLHGGLLEIRPQRHRHSQPGGIAMMYLTPEAQQRLDEYLTGVRAALAGCASVDPDEIEQDICAHIAAKSRRGRSGSAARSSTGYAR